MAKQTQQHTPDEPAPRPSTKAPPPRRRLNYGIATREFVLLECYPLSILWAWPLQGKIYLQNRALIPAFSGDGPKTGFVLFSLLLTLIRWMVTIGFFMYPAPAVTYLEVLYLHALMALRHGVVAIKYAFLTPAELDHLATTLDWSFQGSIMMVSSWLDPTPDVLSRELSLVEPKLHCAWDAVKVRCVRYLQDENIHGLSRSGSPEYHIVRAIDILLAILGLNPDRRTRFRGYSHALAGAHVLIALVYALVAHDSLDEVSEWSWVLICCICLVNYWNLYVNMLFLATAYSHYRRLHGALKVLGQLLLDCSDRAWFESLLPTIDTSSSSAERVSQYTHLDCSQPETIRGFLLMRDALKDMGVLYRKRIEAFVTLFLMYICVIVVLFLGQLLFNFEQNVDLTVIILTAVLNIGTFTLGLAGMAYRGGQINIIHKAEHMQYLLRHKIEGYFQEHEMRRVATTQEKSQLWMADRVLKTTLTTLSNTKPIRLFGFKAGDSFIKGLVTLVASAIIAGIRELSR